MKTNITEEKLIVVSDVHLGNFMFRARRPFIEFLQYAWANGYNLCINGDGVDIVQTSLRQITRDMAECASQLRRFSRKGLRVYYTVGNHDIILEHFLDDWAIIRVLPFLNVTSGQSRIRVEHGHLYDGSFVNYPTLYMLATLIGGAALKIHPSLYKGIEKLKPAIERARRLIGKYDEVTETGEGRETIPNEPLEFLEWADEISKHGFDYVIFGHTHCCGRVTLKTGATYINTGSWLFEPHYAEINHGEVTLRRVCDHEPVTSVDFTGSEYEPGYTRESRRTEQPALVQ